ncbi:hypothetical protein BJ878DRAFT_425668, partial [Calycina marina]
QWSAIAREYSSSQLTFAKDRLTVFAGIASKLRTTFQNDDYLVGMWSGILVLHLCWNTQAPNRMSRPGTYIAPIWSWVSCNSAIGFNTRWLTEPQTDL